MKSLWLKLSSRLDALSLRERVFVFAAVVAAVIYAANSLVLGPLAARQRALSAKVTEQQNTISDLARQIEEKVRLAQIDPDAAARKQLAVLVAEIEQRGNALQSMQRGLVTPDKIAPMLEGLLRANGKLRLVSLRTLPVTGLSGASVEPLAAPAKAEEKKPAELDSAVLTAAALKDAQPAQPAAPDLSKLPGGLGGADGAGLLAAAHSVAPAPAAAAPGAPPPKPPELMFRHGVELTLQGNYVDMVNYLTALESRSPQLFWGKAKLDAHDFQSAQLTLTVYTLNLDQNWMRL